MAGQLGRRPKPRYFFFKRKSSKKNGDFCAVRKKSRFLCYFLSAERK
jgi:hypothetical protein